MQIFSFFHRTIPVGSAQNNRSLSLILGVLVFLLSCVIACVFLFSHGFHTWENNKIYKITIEIPVDLQKQSTSVQEQKIEKVIQTLKEQEGVLNIQPVDPEKLRSMLTVWIGDSKPNYDFPLPTLLDVEIDSKVLQNIDVIKQKLWPISSDISFENHNTWSQKLMIFGKSLKIITLMIGSFILSCAAIIVVLVTKSALQAYYTTLDTLRLLGAKNSYIARIFQNQILRSSFCGGFFGVILAIPTIYAFMIILKYLGLEGITWNTVLWHIIVLVLSIPFLVAFIGVLVSRITVLWHLRNLDAV